MKRLSVVSLLGIMTIAGWSRAGSIFDPTPQGDSNSQTPSTPASPPPRTTQVPPAPAPTPAPAPAPPANQPAQGNAAPAPPAASHALDDDMNALDANARAQIAAARKAVEDFRKAAEEKTMAALEATQLYRIALDQANSAEKNLEETRITGDTSQKLKASASAARANAKLKQMRDNAFTNSEDLREARQLEATFAKSAPAGPDPQAAPSPDDEIAKAIREHQLVVGMTLQQAEQSAGAPAEFESQFNDRSRYRWRITGPTGTTTRFWTDALGHQRQSQEPRQGLIAEVHATFEDGKLVSFDRFNFRH